MTERKNIIISANHSLQTEPDLELGLLGENKIVRSDGRFGYVGEADNLGEAMNLIDDILGETGRLLWHGDAVDVKRTVKKREVVRKRGKVGLW